MKFWSIISISPPLWDRSEKKLFLSKLHWGKFCCAHLKSKSILRNNNVKSRSEKSSFVILSFGKIQLCRKFVVRFEISIKLERNVCIWAIISYFVIHSVHIWSGEQKLKKNKPQKFVINYKIIIQPNDNRNILKIEINPWNRLLHLINLKKKKIE